MASLKAQLAGVPAEPFVFGTSPGGLQALSVLLIGVAATLWTRRRVER
ncbi:MAG: hypothetical protein HY675_10740 [Chloroflexi bacterium]|nr:hypothetical protein [Chloroflexota bacterium]